MTHTRPTITEEPVAVRVNQKPAERPVYRDDALSRISRRIRMPGVEK